MDTMPKRLSKNRTGETYNGLFAKSTIQVSSNFSFNESFLAYSPDDATSKSQNKNVDYGGKSGVIFNQRLLLIIALILLTYFSGSLVNEFGVGAASVDWNLEREMLGSEVSEPKEDNSLEYLTKFGYMEDKPNALRSKDELKDEQKRALIRLQAMAQLPQTGELDHATREQMNMSRCGVSDGPVIGSVDPNDPLKYELGPSKWGRTDLTYKILSHKETRKLPSSLVNQELQRAMKLWEDKSTIRFYEADSRDGKRLLDRSGLADIEVSFERGAHGDRYDFDGPGKVLAHAFSPGNGIGGDVHFDEDEAWTSQTSQGTNFLIVAAHELGHALGLSHSREKGALMYPWYAGYVENYELHSDDVMGIRFLYGSERSNQATTPRMETMSPTATTAATTGPGRMDTCGRVDSVALLRGEIFAFSGKLFWWMTAEGIIKYGPYQLQDYWIGLPSSVQKIDAAFERSENGNIVFFSGNRYYEFDGNRIMPRYRLNGQPITELGIDRDVTHIDGAMTWAQTKRTYLFSGRYYWRVRVGGSLSMDYGYPMSVNKVWNGIPFPIDAVYTNTKDETIFIKGSQYWLYDNNRSQPQAGYPQSLHKLWAHCRQFEISSSPASHSSSMTSVLLIGFVFILQFLQNSRDLL